LDAPFGGNPVRAATRLDGRDRRGVSIGFRGETSVRAGDVKMKIMESIGTYYSLFGMNGALQPARSGFSEKTLRVIVNG
jgi:hypothetical protein